MSDPNVSAESSNVDSPADSRTNDQKIVDSTLGVQSNGKLDKLADRAVASSRIVLRDGRHVLDSLKNGECLQDYVLETMAAGAKRENAIKRIHERIQEATGASDSAIRINEWIAVSAVALLGTGSNRVKDIDASILDKLSYTSLSKLRPAVSLTGKTGKFSIAEGWIDFLQSSIRNGSKGKELDSKIEEHEKYLDSLKRTETRSKMTPDQLIRADRAELAKEAAAALNQRVKTVSSFVEKAIVLGISPAEIARGLEPAGLLADSSDSIRAIADTLTPDQAKMLVDRLVSIGNVAGFGALASAVQAVMVRQASLAAA